MKHPNLARMIVCLGDRTRLDILLLLNVEKSLVSSMIAVKLGIRPSVASYHLRLLVEKGFVKSTKSGRYVLYHMNKENVRVFLTELHTVLGVVE